MPLIPWDLIASFVVGVVAASVAWGVWNWTRPGARSVADPPADPVTPPEPAIVRAAPASESRTVPTTRPPVPGLRTSQRVILHLARQPRMGYGDVAPRSCTQAGMTDALEIPQPALTKVLARLVDGGALLTTRTHVSGEPRRLKVYQLTAHGEAIARDLRRRAATAVPPRAAPDVPVRYTPPVDRPERPPTAAAAGDARSSAET